MDLRRRIHPTSLSTRNQGILNPETRALRTLTRFAGQNFAYENMTRTIALDWETYYDNECTIQKLGARGYFMHPKFDAYLLSAVSNDGVRWVGHPTEFDWSLIEGAQVLAHNAAFDETLYWFGVEQGWYPRIDFTAWDCTLDLCSFHGIRRSLKNAVKDVFGVELSKETRDDMQNLDWDQMLPEFKQEVMDYALSDSEWCLKLWERLSDAWPEFERQVSRQTREMCRRGVSVDEVMLRGNIERLAALKFEMEGDVPWTERGAKLKSRIAFDEECRKHGLVPPKSLAKSSPEAVAWFDEHESQHAWMAAFRNVGRVNTILKKLQTVEQQTCDGKHYPVINYFLAHTGRFTSGGGDTDGWSGRGVNYQNMPRGEMFGVDFRKQFVASPGKKLVVIDLSQIEIRTALYLAGATSALDLIANTDDVYEALAIAFELWSKEQGSLQENAPELRQDTKIVGLGVFYGASGAKVSTIGKISQSKAEKWVELVKSKFPEIPALWAKLTRAISQARRSPDRVCRLVLPSGRAIQYRNVRYEGSGLVCAILKGKGYATVRPWFGMLCENISQGMARDVICDSMLRVEAANWPVLWHCHDELIMEVDEDRAEECLAEASHIMCTAPTWASTIPLDAKGTIVDHYTK